MDENRRGRWNGRAGAALAYRPGGPFGLTRRIVPLLLAVACLFVGWDGLFAVDWRLVRTELGAVSAAQWWLAAAAAAVSYFALGRYDAAMHRLFATGVAARAAVPAGSAAIAIGQTTGFGLAVGAIVRWRLLPQLSFADALRLTIAVSFSFIAGWALVAALCIALLLPGGGPWDLPLRVAAAAVLASAAAAFAVLVLRPRFQIRGTRVSLPPCRTVGKIFLLTAADTIAAGLALYALLPPDQAPGFVAFLPAFLIALGAGLLSGTPGGIGPFELAIAALLPTVGAEALAAAILSYRLVYYAVPALLAGALLAFWPGGKTQANAAPVRPVAGGIAELEWLRRAAPRAESLILAQGEHRLLRLDGGVAGWIVGTSGQTMAALFDPLADPAGTRRLLNRLAGAAAAEDRVACVYKAGARTAALARRAGWVVSAIADECWLAPAGFALDGPARAGLRRKLRHAAAAGVTVAAWQPGDGPAALPVSEMEAIARHWARRRGGERGFSTGRFDKAYVARQRVYLARAGGTVLAFATFHQSAREWTLDLMRHHDGAPDGTMACLVAAAIADAKQARVRRLSLAAVPLAPAWCGARLARLLRRLSGGDGLGRFKALFAPERERLYIAARSRPALAVVTLDLARAIRFPVPLPAETGARSSACATRPHDLHEELAFDNS